MTKGVLKKKKLERHVWCLDDVVRMPATRLRPTDDEVVHSKRLGNKVLVDLNRSNPFIVIWDALVGQKKFKHVLEKVKNRGGCELLPETPNVGLALC